MSASMLRLAMDLPGVLAYVAHASQLHGRHTWPAYIATLIFLLSRGTADCLCVSLSGLYSCDSPNHYAATTFAGGCEA